MEEKYIIALEIGSSKIKGATGVIDSSGNLTVKAVEEEKIVDCVRYGCILNVAEVANRIKNIISRLESREPNRTVKSVYVAIGGKSLTATVFNIERQLSAEMEITDDIISQIYNEALATRYNDRDVVQVMPRDFKVDHITVSQPVGTMGRSIQCALNIVTLRSQIKKNLRTVLETRLRLDIKDFIVRPIAESRLVLSENERRLGCMLVDFGAETTTVAIYKGGVLLYLATIPLGSRNITRDIQSLNFLPEQAEELKKTGGNASTTPQGSYGPDGRDYTDINMYVSARAGEIIANINQQITYAGLSERDLPGGIVIVGNGACLKGFNERLSEVTHLPVKAGIPSVRVADSSINVAGSIDVISVLHAASANPQECTLYTEPEIEEEVPEEPETVHNDPEGTTEHVDTVEDPFEDEVDDDFTPEPHKPRRTNIFNKFINSAKDRLTNIMNYEDLDDRFDSENDNSYDNRRP